MKILCTVEFEAPDGVLAKDVEAVVRHTREHLQGDVPEWQPKVSVQLPSSGEVRQGPGTGP